MNISAITFTPVRGGPQEGICTVWVMFGEGTPIPPSEVVRRIIEFTGSSQLKHVTIGGDFASEDNDLMFAFVKALRDFGFGVRVHSDGQSFPPWFTLVTWLVVSTDPTTPWLRFACHELRHRIESPGDPEPPLPANNPPCYVLASSLDMAVSFVRKAKSAWGILISGSEEFVEPLIINPPIKLRLER